VDAGIVRKHVVQEGIDAVVDAAEHPEKLLNSEIQFEEGFLVNKIPK